MPSVEFTVMGAPLSTNQAYKLTSRGPYARMYLSPEAKEFKNRCGLIAASTKPPAWNTTGRYRLELGFYFKNQRPDSDGPLKLVLDALQGHLYNNDRQVDEVHYRRFVDADAPRVEIKIEEKYP